MPSLDWTGNHFLDAEIVRALVAGLAKGEWDPTQRRDRTGTDLIDAISHHLNLPADFICIAPGSAAGIDAILRSFPNERIVNIVPNFRQTRDTAWRDNREYIELPMHPGIDLLQSIRPFCGSSSLLVLSSPSVAFGVSVLRASLDAVLAAWRGPVLVDEAYAEFSSSSVIDLTIDHPNLMVSRTFSKAWGMADLRVSYIVSRSVKNTKHFLSSYMPGYIPLAVARSLILDPVAVNESVKRAKCSREIIISRLSNFIHAPKYPTQSNYISVFCDSARAATERLRGDGIVVMQLRSLSDWPRDWADGFRFSICPIGQAERVVQAISELLAFGANCRLTL